MSFTKMQEPQVYTVSANKDQLEKKFPQYLELFTEVNPRMPNRVTASFLEKARASEVYNSLHFNQMVAFRNWLD